MFKSIASKLVAASASAALASAIIASSASALSVPLKPVHLPCAHHSPQIALTSAGVRGTCFVDSDTAYIYFLNFNGQQVYEVVSVSADGTFTTPLLNPGVSTIYGNDPVLIIAEEYDGNGGEGWESNELQVNYAPSRLAVP
jgi:hypothetical protein